MEPITLRPQPGPQEHFARSSADIVIFGGAAGGGKSFALLMEPLYHIHVPGFSTTIFRQSYTHIAAPGRLWDVSATIYPLTGATMRKSEMAWVWPNGAKVKFAHLANDDSVYAWQGSQIALIGWDELTHHSAHQFWYMLSRNRSTCGVKPYIRATCNPDAESWVANLIAWWIDQDTGYPIPERSGKLRAFIRENDEIVWVEPGTRDAAGLPAKTITFIPSKVSDNPALLQSNPAYLSNLLALPLVERERLLAGNWKIVHAAGKVFNRAHVPIVEAYPTGGGEIVRFWDFAATASTYADFTAGVKMLKYDGAYYVLDCFVAQLGPAEVERQFINITRQDVQHARSIGARYASRWEQEPGAAAKLNSARLIKELAGIDCKGIPPQGDKIARARALARQVEISNVYVVAGPWNERYLSELHAFPDGKHDDVVDGSSGSFNALASLGVYRARQYDGNRDAA